MTGWLAVLPVGLIVLTSWAAGWLAGRKFSSSQGWVFQLVLGLLLLHGVMQWSSMIGLAWSRTSLAVLLLASSLLIAFFLRGFEVDPGCKPVALAWGDGVCALAVLVFGGVSLSLVAVHPDFVFHWGPKSERFYLARGIDWTYLSWPETGIFHPDYPHLIPDLFAASGLFLGEFDERAQQVWSVVFLAIVWAVCRKAIGADLLKTAFGNMVLIAVVCTTASFGIAYYQAAGPDLPFAAFVLLSVVELIRRDKTSEGVLFQACRFGVFAALLSSCKLEGVVMAGFLLGLAVWRLRPQVDSPGSVALLGLGLFVPGLFANLPWAVGVFHNGLLQSSNSGAPDLTNLGPVLSTMFDVLWLKEWQGLCLVMLLLPILLKVRRYRTAAGFLLLQLLFYFFVYMTSPHEPIYFVLSNFPRLLYHLVPGMMLIFLLSLWGQNSGAEDRVELHGEIFEK